MLHKTNSSWRYAIAIAVLILIVGVSLWFDTIGSKELVLALLPLFGTFLGATFAFRLNEEKEARKELATRRQALNRALFILLRQENAIRQLKTEFDAQPTMFAKAFLLPAHKPPAYADLRQNFTDLEFLLDAADPQLLFELTIEQERFEQAMEAMRIRNDAYVGDVQPAIAEHQLAGKLTTAAELKNKLGERIYDCAVNGARAASEHLDASALSLPEMHDKLFAVAKTLFADTRFVRPDTTAPLSPDATKVS